MTELDEILRYMSDPSAFQNEKEGSRSKSLQFVITMLGSLLIREHRVMQFLKNDTLWLSSMSYGSVDQSHYLVKIMARNTLCESPALRRELLSHFRQTIKSLQMPGKYSVLILYINNSSYSLLTQQQLQCQMAPTVQHLKHFNKFWENNGPKKLKSNEMGTKLHSFVERYILGAGFIHNQQFLKDLRSYKVKYDLNILTLTIDYIIGREMLEGGYEKIASEKLFNTCRFPLNFNRLDLLLRRADKVLVIDWKFSCFSAKDYFKHYRKKMHKYMRLAKKHYDCDVQFHLYCIHIHTINGRYRFTMKDDILPKDKEIVLSDEDVEEIEPIEPQDSDKVIQADQVREVEDQPMMETDKEIVIID